MSYFLAGGWLVRFIAVGVVFAGFPVLAVVFGAWWALFVAVADAGAAEALVWSCGSAVGVFFGVFVAVWAVCGFLFWVSAFVDHVFHVGFLCCCGEVVGVDAFGVVAGVHDLVAVWDWAFVDGVGVAVGEPFLFVGLEVSVVFAVECACPFPAVVVVGGAVDFFPESLGGGHFLFVLWGCV